MFSRASLTTLTVTPPSLGETRLYPSVHSSIWKILKYRNAFIIVHYIYLHHPLGPCPSRRGADDRAELRELLHLPLRPHQHSHDRRLQELQGVRRAHSGQVAHVFLHRDLALLIETSVFIPSFSGLCVRAGLQRLRRRVGLRAVSHQGLQEDRRLSVQRDAADHRGHHGSQARFISLF